jgi:hypothetical protein
MNGIDAVVLATGNDFRSRSGHTCLCSKIAPIPVYPAKIENDTLPWLEIPLALEL